MEGFVKVDGDAVSVAAKRAYEVQKIEDDKLKEEYRERVKKSRAMMDYWSSGKAKKDFNDAWNSVAKEEEYTTYKDGWFFRKEVKSKRLTCSCRDQAELLNILSTKSECWDDVSVFGCISEKRLYGEISIFVFDYTSRVYPPPNYQANHFKQYFDLKGDVFLSIEEYNKLKEFMDERLKEEVG